MALTPGTRLGPYEILSPLGAGGMGEVYRARDTRLGRDVAIKALPEEFAREADRLRRFEREARSASALSDAHIVTVYDIGEASGVHYFACELVEGTSLRNLVDRGPVPTRRILELAGQIASGLAAAHEKGITHRDLKPENVLLTKSGEAKIADFGLAKLTEARDSQASQIPTADGHQTSAGIVMGTVSYMSPEQASGRAIDFRSDQFSLGTILYEMMTGRRPFQRPTTPQTLSAIIQDEPEPIAAAGPEATLLRWMIERLLAKDPEDRYSSTKDLARDLKSFRAHLSEAGALAVSGAIPEAPRRGRPWTIGFGIALSLAALLALALTTARLLQRRSPPTYEQVSFRRGTLRNARFSPDGHTVIYSASFENNPVEIYEKRAGSPESRPLGFPGDNLLSVCRDGRLAISLSDRTTGPYLRRGTLAELPLGGTGAPRELLENVYAADWSPDGSALAVLREASGEFQLEYPIGKVLHRSSGWMSHVRVSPDGGRVAFLEHPAPNDDGGSVAVVDRDGHRRALATGFQTAEGLAWSANGREVWFTASPSGQNLWLYGVTLGGKVRVIDRAPGALQVWDISSEGKVLASREAWRVGLSGQLPGESRESDLSWLDWSVATDISKDGNLILFDEAGEGGGPGYSVFLRKGTEPAVRLGEGFSQGLSPDNQSVVAIRQSAVDPQLVIYPTGAGQPRLLPRDGLTAQRVDWMPDGRHLLVSANEAGKAVRLWIVDPVTGARRGVSPEGYRHFSRCVFHDGSRVIAEGPDRGIYLYPLAGGEPKLLPGLNEEDQPSGWLSDGRSFFVYRRTSAKIDIYDSVTGTRRFGKEVAPPDPTGVIQINRFMATPDGSAYIYNYQRFLSELFEVDGLN